MEPTMELGAEELFELGNFEFFRTFVESHEN